MTIKTDLQKDGFVIIPDVYDCAQLDALGNTVRSQVAYHAGKEYSKLLSNWQRDSFHADLIRLRKEQPKKASIFYDTMQTNAVLRGFVLSPHVCNIVAEALDVNLNSLSASGELLRMDHPGDNKNALLWHQDWNYYPHNKNGTNGLSAWTPLQDVGRWNGSIEICPGSHHGGHVFTKPSGKGNSLGSRQFLIPDSYISKYEPISVEAKAGSLVLISMYLFHRSGHNLSKRVRFSTTVRFHKALSADFTPGRLQYEEIEGYDNDWI